MESTELVNLVLQKLGGIESQLSSIKENQQRLESSLVKLEKDQLIVKQTTMTSLDTCQSQCQGTRDMQNRMNASIRETAANVRKLVSSSMKNNPAAQQKPATRPLLNVTHTLLNRNESSLSTTSEDEIIKDAEFDRKCMAKAIKRNTVAIVDNIPFNDSEIPDMIISKCVDESECETIRKIPQTKDKLRTLVRIITKRSFTAMTEFVNIVKRFNSGIAEAIEVDFDELKHEEKRSTALCTLCEIKENVDVKDVCDHYYEKEMITDDLHGRITNSESPENRRALWEVVLVEMSNQSSEYVMTILISALKHNGTFYSNLERCWRETYRDVVASFVAVTVRLITNLHSCR